MARRIIQGFAPLLLLLGCGGGTGTVVPAGADGETIHLVRFGWHADVVLPVGTCGPLPDAAPESLLSADRVAVGWGDARYFPRENPGVVDAVRAALLPSAAVLQIRAVNVPVERLYHEREILALRLTSEECVRLGDFIRASFVVEEGDLVGVPTDRDTRATYYLSADTYHLLHNCNHWVAEALRYGGVRVRPALVPTVELLWQSVERAAATRNDVRRLP